MAPKIPIVDQKELRGNAYIGTFNVSENTPKAFLTYNSVTNIRNRNNPSIYKIGVPLPPEYMSRSSRTAIPNIWVILF